VVVVATIALLAGFALPAIRALLDSFETQSGAKTLISTALASARAIAAKEQRYAGVRFQQVYDPEGPLEASQYMVYIVNDPNLVDARSANRYKVAYGFRVIEGVKPIKLPKSAGAMELVEVPNQIGDPNGIIEKTTFSIVFSPTGKLVIHKVATLRRNALDRVFNDSSINPMFIDDYNDRLPFWQELSQNRLIIYDRDQFYKLNPQNRFDYLNRLELIYINPYTGTMILPD
jgi:hypothetical protein